ncbi:MAG: hypothetical protein J5634_03250 [Bacilli bacterium]|nr:hypothetical protein [Bacilli bacterium]
MEKIKINDNDRKVVRGLSKFIAVLNKIGRVFIYVGIIAIIIVMSFIPTIVNHTKIKNDSIIIGYSDRKLEIKKDGNKTIFYEDGKKIGSDKDTEVYDFIVNKFDKYSNKQLIGYTESYFIIIVAYLFITSIILKYAEKLFKNISSEKTPFTSDNLELIYNTLKYKIVAIVIPIIGIIIFDAILKLGNPFDFSSTGLVDLLMMFVFLYVFKYACQLQSNSSETFYD